MLNLFIPRYVRHGVVPVVSRGIYCSCTTIRTQRHERLRLRADIAPATRGKYTIPCDMRVYGGTRI